MNTFNFGKALNHLQDSKRVARKGWNGKGMYIMLVYGAEWHVDSRQAEPAQPSQGDPLAKQLCRTHRSYRLFTSLTELLDFPNFSTRGDTHRPSLSELQTDGFLLMKTAKSTLVPWFASQADILADDWCVID